jgi:hypothetical protein
MIHYHVWFSIRSGLEEEEALAIVRTFLAELETEGEIAGFHLLRNSGAVGKTKMLPFQAVILFRDDTQFGAAFSAQTQRGIHTGWHGRVMAAVGEFQIEVFRPITAFSPGAERGLT